MREIQEIKGVKLSILTKVESVAYASCFDKVRLHTKCAVFSSVRCSVLALCLLSLSNFAEAWERSTSLQEKFLEACKNGEEKTAEILMNLGANINAPIKETSALHWAAIMNRPETVKFLIKNGADVNANIGYSGTPLHKASGFGNKEIVKILIANGADVNAKIAIGGQSSLHDVDGSFEIAQCLIKNGADVNAQSNINLTPLHSASKFGHEEIVKLLIANGADVNAHTTDRCYPIHQVSDGIKKSSVILRLLIQSGADVNAQTDAGFTPLHRASRRSFSEKKKGDSATEETIMTILLEHGARVNEKTNFGITPVHWAAENPNRKVLEMLIKFGAKIDVKDKDGRTPVEWAAIAGLHDNVKILMK